VKLSSREGPVMDVTARSENNNNKRRQNDRSSREQSLVCTHVYRSTNKLYELTKV